MPGRELLQIPGPSNIPRRVLEAVARPTIDHRGPEFAEIALSVHRNLQRLACSEGPVVLYPASGTGAWEAALANTMSPKDRLLFFETGHFAVQWQRVAARLGLCPHVIRGDWRRGVVASDIATALAEDTDHAIRAVCIVHNETSTGAVSDVREVREVIDAAGHPALLFVDVISSLGSLAYDHDDWGVDVTVGASQKGLMLPPGLSFNAVGARALAACERATCARAYWDWTEMLRNADTGSYPFTPSTNLVVGLDEALRMLLDEEGLDAVVARHHRLAEAARKCVQAWGLEFQCEVAADRSDVVTAVRLPEGHDADTMRAVVRERFGVALGNGLGSLAGKVFRIGHLGDYNETMLCGTLGAIEMGLRMSQIPLRESGLPAALDYLAASA